ncbi:7611_t:CDS:2, partial [Paraglomus occultum]
FSSDINSNAQSTLPSKDQNEKDVIHLKSVKLPIKKEATETVLQSKKLKFGGPQSAHGSDSRSEEAPLASSSTKKISHEELTALYERENKRGEKNIANITRLLGS